MMTSIHIGFKIKCLIQNGTGVNVHMKITFFIGNGFDLKMGLKSRYKDFYNYLLSQNYENIIVDKIKDNPDEWADFELACGKELRNITIDNMEEFIGAFGNFKIEFSKYLSEQEKDINYDQLSDEIADKTCNSINISFCPVFLLHCYRVTQSKLKRFWLSTLQSIYFWGVVWAMNLSVNN